MSSNPDSSDFPAPYARIGLSACLGVLTLLVLAACSSRPPFFLTNPKTPLQEAQPVPAAPTPTPAPAQQSSARPGLTQPAAPGNAEQASAAALSHAALTSLPSTAPPPTDTLVSLLAYADRVRTLPAPELFREIARLGNPATPAEQLQLALSLSQLHQAAELARAQELLNRILSNPSAPAQPLQPLARLLAARYADQRRLEDQLEKQIQQTRDVQRRLEQTRERLEALKAIERSLTSRPPAAPASAASAPAGRRNRTPAP